MKFEDFYKKLNKEQKAAVDTIDGPVMVIAGPGTGKTELLSLRVAQILQKAEITPGNVLCLTFSDAGAFNMRERLIQHIGSTAYRVAVHTFHSFGIEIMNRYPERFYNGASLLPADDATQTEILEGIFAELPHDNPLRSIYEGRFVNLFSVKKAIEHLKKGGLTPLEFKTVLIENEKALTHADAVIQRLFTDRITKKTILMVSTALNELQIYQSKKPLPSKFLPLTDVLFDSLKQVLTVCQEQDTTKPLTAWKDKWTSKGDDKLTHLNDFLSIDKMKVLSDIYEEYTLRMRAEGYYDYNDMILDALAVLERDVGVRLDLQERYQYILVDEFQDTNQAQMRLLYLLTDNPVHEGRPNIMAVGDDDQAIFKFQGAEATNVIDFRNLYRDPAMVVLTQNYRSTQNILDAARHIITKGTARLENIMPELRKELTAANKNLPKGAIISREFASRDLEYQWIIKEIKQLRKGGIPARKIAVIAREHKELQALVPHFHAAQLPISYERQQNVLQEPLILQLITMARFVNSLMKKELSADDLLPAILNYPFWGLDRAEVWKLSVTAGKNAIPWLKAMRDMDGKLKEIAEFFIDLGAKATHETAEEILHELIGGPQLILPDENGEEMVEIRDGMFSPFRSYYFSRENFEKRRAEYMRFLSSLQSFVGSLREYRRGRDLSLADMLGFVDTHIKNKLPINNISPFINAADAIQLLSAHKAKGLQFEAVFVINCQEDVWMGKSNSRDIRLPKNLPLAPASDDLDDRLRIFYVAITRAQHRLYLTSYHIDESGDDSIRLALLTPEEGAPEVFHPESVALDGAEEKPEEALSRWWDAQHVGPFTLEEKAILNPILDTYHLSVTHLQNFLNVVDAGPIVFLEKNLLMFPEPKTASGAFGSAIHDTIQSIYVHLKNDGKLPALKHVTEWFENFLIKERLNKKDFEQMRKRGEKALSIFYEAKKKTFSPNDYIELSFKNQGATVGEVLLTGKVDRMAASGLEMVVYDFKTGKAVNSWTPWDSYEKLKVWKYRMQLGFYKLLIENSRDFGNKYSVRQGVIQFVEPLQGKLIDLPLEMESAYVERLSALIIAVHHKIKKLDFPDVSKYPKDLSGIMAFEEDLLKSSI